MLSTPLGSSTQSIRNRAIVVHTASCVKSDNDDMVRIGQSCQHSGPWLDKRPNRTSKAHTEQVTITGSYPWSSALTPYPSGQVFIGLQWGHRDMQRQLMHGSAHVNTFQPNL